MDRRTRTWYWGLGALLVLLFALRTAGRRNEGDLVVYYETWQRVLAGQDMYHRLELQPPTPTAYIYPPPFALVFAPLGALPYAGVRFLWCLGSGLLALRALDVGLRMVQRGGQPRHPWLTPALGAALWLRFVLDDLGHGQVNTLVTALAVEGAWRAERGRERSGALCLAAAIALKLTPALLLLGYLLAGRRSMVLRTSLAVAGWLLLPGLVYGVGGAATLLVRFVGDVTGWNYALHVCVPANASLTGLVHHLLVGFAPHAGAPPVPALLALDPAWARGLASGLGLLVAAALGWWVVRTRPEPARRTAVLLAAVPLISPVTWKHHLTGLLLAYLLAARSLLEERASRPARAVLLVGIALTALSTRALVGRGLSDALLRWGGVTIGVALLVLGTALAATPGEEASRGAQGGP